MGRKREAGVSHEKNDSDKTVETVAETGQTGFRCSAARLSVSVYGSGWTAALGNHFQGAEVYGDGGGAAFTFAGHRNHFSAGGAFMAGGQPHDEEGCDPQCYISS